MIRAYKQNAYVEHAILNSVYVYAFDCKEKNIKDCIKLYGHVVTYLMWIKVLYILYIWSPGLPVCVYNDCLGVVMLENNCFLSAFFERTVKNEIFTALYVNHIFVCILNVYNKIKQGKWKLKR